MNQRVALLDSLPALAARFAARRARLTFDLANEPRRVEGQRPIAKLQDYGYSVAAGFAVVAVLPIVVRVLFRQRTLLFKILMAAFRIRTMRRAIAPRRDVDRTR